MQEWQKVLLFNPFKFCRSSLNVFQLEQLWLGVKNKTHDYFYTLWQIYPTGLCILTVKKRNMYM